MAFFYGFYTELCAEWEDADAEMQAAYPSLALKHRSCGGAILLYFSLDRPYDEARCKGCCATWHIQVVAKKVSG